MIKQGTIIGTFEYDSDELDTNLEITVEINYTDDSGTYYDDNGTGTPASLDWSYKIISIYDTINEKELDDNIIKIKYEDIEDDLEQLLSDNLNNDNYYDNLF